MPTSHPTEQVSSSQPLLHDQPTAHSPSTANGNHEPLQSRRSRFKIFYTGCKTQVSDFLSSRAQHWTVLGLVSFDLLGIFADIIINLYQCDEKDTDPIWDDVRNALGIAGLVFSCLFMLELVLSVWAFGWRWVALMNIMVSESILIRQQIF
jgi:voltage-gated hydrogen channel 1